jgi:hypothetical protein
VTKALENEAARLYSLVASAPDFDPSILTHYTAQTKTAAGAEWARAGATRLVVPLARVDARYVVKLGFAPDMAIEQEIWNIARRSQRRFLLPLVTYWPGGWSVFPQVRPLPRRFLSPTRVRGESWLGVQPDLAEKARKALGPLYREAALALGHDYIAVDDLYMDLEMPDNWGLWRGKPYVIDYGWFDEDEWAIT